MTPKIGDMVKFVSKNGEKLRGLVVAKSHNTIFITADDGTLYKVED